MARGNEIVVSANPRGVFMEGYVATAEKPGTILQLDATVALKGGRHTFKKYARAADGDRPAGPLYVLLPDNLQGKTAADAYVAGTRCFLYTPLPGEEVNLLLADVAGTADDHLAGEVLIVQNNTGKLIATAGTPQSQPFVLLESVTDPVADTLVWVMYSGY